jgi:hypothetical protein
VSLSQSIRAELENAASAGDPESEDDPEPSSEQHSSDGQSVHEEPVSSDPPPPVD